MKNLGVIVPCYNEEEALPQTAREIEDAVRKMMAMELISSDSRIYFVDDGSDDGSWQIIEALHRSSPLFSGLKLSRNHGHQNALLAGLLSIPEEMTITIDADLQDDVNLMEAMVRSHYSGADIVYGVRSGRANDTGFKRWTANAFYAGLRWLGVEVIAHHADFRFMSRRAVSALAEYNEVNLFVRGVIPRLGFKTGSVFYKRAPRLAGKSKYPLSKMVSLALNGVTSFSIRPLHFITALGIAVSLLSGTLAVWGLFIKMFTTRALPGWASTVIPMYFLGGIQLLSLGIIGEYLGKIYMETKRRPRFIIEQALGMGPPHLRRMD